MKIKKVRVITQTFFTVFALVAMAIIGHDQILFSSPRTFTNDSVLNPAGAALTEVYGVEFGAGSQLTLNGYGFQDVLA